MIIFLDKTYLMVLDDNPIGNLSVRQFGIEDYFCFFLAICFKKLSSYSYSLFDCINYRSSTFNLMELSLVLILSIV